MTNVVKHAGATKCKVVISITRKKIDIQVSDNGKGLDANSTHTSGIGLNSIRSKIKLLKGEIHVNSVSGKGTTIQVVIPQHENKNNNNT